VSAAIAGAATSADNRAAIAILFILISPKNLNVKPGPTYVELKYSEYTLPSTCSAKHLDVVDP
jgi:hypothetical protein